MGGPGMNILITGAKGFVGRNLTAALEAVRDGKDRTRPGLCVGELYLYDVDSDPAQLALFCKKADFVFHLAGVNRPRDNEAFMRGNAGFTGTLLDTLKACRNMCPVMLASSIQATLAGRYAGSEYGKSKRAGEELLFAYGEETGARVLVYRFPNLFGKWCRPDYNSVVATFCHRIARDMPITVHDRGTRLELLYIDDLLEEMFAALAGREHRCEYDGVHTVMTGAGRFCAAPATYLVSLGEIVDLLERFRAQPETLVIPEMPPDSFAKKLYATYLSYLPKERIAVPLRMNADARGSFTELFKTENCGQLSVNISKPGVTKGEHWHHTKWEFFVVVSGHGLIEERRIGSDEVLRFEVSGDKIEAVHMLPGYTHRLVNLSETADLITVMWANECFDPERPDTYYEEV